MYTNRNELLDLLVALKTVCVARGVRGEVAHPGGHVDHAGGGVHGGLEQQRGHGETVQFCVKTGWEPSAQQELQRDVDEEGVEHRGC